MNKKTGSFTKYFCTKTLKNHFILYFWIEIITCILVRTNHLQEKANM